MDRDEAKAELLKILPPGTNVYCILRHVARSGMMRCISLIVIDGYPRDISRLACKAAGFRESRNHEGIEVGGCGMDMGFHLVYELGRTLYPDGHGCAGPDCHSNEHTNGDRSYEPHSEAKPHWHRDGGYALRKVWL